VVWPRASNSTASESKNLTNHKGRYFTAMLSKIFIAATLATTAMAYCPNGCSGHGTCQTNPKVSLPLLHPTSLTPNASIVSQTGMDQRKRPKSHGTFHPGLSNRCPAHKETYPTHLPAVRWHPIPRAHPGHHIFMAFFFFDENK
jgi:hypothetical protein